MNFFSRLWLKGVHKVILLWSYDILSCLQLVWLKCRHFEFLPRDPISHIRDIAYPKYVVWIFICSILNNHYIYISRLVLCAKAPFQSSNVAAHIHLISNNCFEISYHIIVIQWTGIKEIPSIPAVHITYTWYGIRIVEGVI